MENNSLTPSPAPTPNPGNNMPEFAAAPAAPAPVIPPATSMPAFGGQPEQAQPVMPMPPEAQAPAQPVAETPEQQPVQEQPTPEQTPKQPAEAQPTSTLGEIQNEQIQASELAAQNQPVQPEPATPFVEAQSTVPQPGNPVVQAPTPEKKKSNVKLLAIIAGGVVLVGGIAAAVLLINQPKPTSNPNNDPVTQPIAEIDTSTKFDNLDKETATAFLNAVGKGESYIPDDFLDENDVESLTLNETETQPIFLYSHKEGDKVDEAAKDGFTKYVKDVKKEKVESIKVEEFTVDDRGSYSVVHYGSGNCSENCPIGISFNESVLNHSNFALFDPTGNSGSDDFTIFNTIKTDDVKNALRVIAYTGIDFSKQNLIYSTEFAENEQAFAFTLNTMSLLKKKTDSTDKKMNTEDTTKKTTEKETSENDSTKKESSEEESTVKVEDYEIVLKKTIHVVDKASKVYFVQKDTEFKKISVSSEDIADLI